MRILNKMIQIAKDNNFYLLTNEMHKFPLRYSKFQFTLRRGEVYALHNQDHLSTC